MAGRSALLRRAVAGVVFAAAMLPSVAAANEITVGGSETCRGWRFGWDVDSSDPGGTRVWVDPGTMCFAVH